MQNTCKRLLSFLVALVLVLGMVPFNALEVFAADSSAATFGQELNDSLVSDIAVDAEVPEGKVAQIGETWYATLAEALNAAKTMTGDVTVEIYGKVTLNSALSGSFESIMFVGKAEDAEIYLDVQGYITATGKKVAFENLTLSKAEGGFITNAGFMNVAFGIYDVAEVAYTKCTFANGAYAGSGKVTYTECTFQKSWDKYGLWAYGDVDVTVDNCVFDNDRGIKMYAEGAAKVTDLTVKNTDFSKLTGKPAIVLTYGESVTLEGNTYSSTGVFELDLDGAPNGTKVASTDKITCSNDNGACGVLVDGKIYTTVAQAAEVAAEGSTVTLLHNSTETVELAEGVILDKNGYDATGVAVKVSVPTGNNFTGYTRGDAIWGEVWGNSKESFVIKVLDADGKVMGTTSLNNIDGIIDGDVNVTWSIKLDTASNTDEYWTMNWTTAPSLTTAPAKVELWVDGVKVSGGNVVLNAPDDLNKIYAAVADEDGKLLSYYTTVSAAGAAATSGQTVQLLRDTTETVELAAGVTLDKNGYTADGVAEGPVAQVGNTKYATIDEAIAAWTNNTTLTLLADATLSDVVTLKSTEHHILNLGTYTLTAAEGKNAFVIKACGTGSAERTAITINADATNPGGIDAGKKCVVYYKYADGGISTEDRPIIKINGGVFTGSTSSFGSAGIYTIGTAARKCATTNITGGTFNCSIVGSGKSKLLISGGTFNYTVSSQGDSTCLRLISGGTFKTLGFMTADSNNTKFWIGTSMGNSNVGVHVDDNGYIVVGGPVVTEAGETFEASSANYSGASSYLQYSSAKNNGLYYTSAKEALADNNKASGEVTVYADELDMTGISYKGAIVVPENNSLSITYPEGTTPTWTVKTVEGKMVVLEQTVVDGVVTNSYTVTTPVAKIGDTNYATLAEAAAAAQAGDEIVLLTDVTEDVTVPAGVIFNGNGKQVGAITAAGEITFKNVTKATNFSVQYTNTTINIGEGACLEITGTGRLVIGHGCTFNITGTITDAKTADKATIQPSLIMPGASFTGAGVTFNVTNAYIKAPSSYCSSSKSASGTFDFNITNSIVETAGKLAFEAQSTAATVNFELKDSVLTTGSHLVFGVSRGEVVIDNSNVNVGTSKQIENQSTMTVKNGSVVNGAVATSSNAKNPGTLIVENATYAVTGEFSGSDLGTGTLIVKKGASFTAGSVTKANIVVDATGMQAGDTVNITADLSKHAGALEVINNDALEAQIVDGKIVLTEKPVAKIGDTTYTSLQEAFKAATEGCTIEILTDVTISEKWDCRDYATNGSHSQFKESVTINGNGHTIKFTGTISDNNWNTVFRFEENATVTDLTVDISAATGAQRVISAKKSLTVDGLTIIGSAKYGIIFGEGATAADLAATEIVIGNSTLTGTRRAISDNEGGKDVKSVVITGNTLNANVYVSASESIQFNNNTAAGEVDLRSYAAENVLSVEAQGNTLNTSVKNYIYAKTADAQAEFTTARPAFKVATKAELNAALSAAQAGDTIILTADIDYGTDQLKIEKAITLDLGGKTLTTRNAYGGMSVKNNPTIKNGTIVHASNTAAIKVWNATAFEDLVIDVQGKGDANKTIGGIVLQSGTTTCVGSIKNVTIKGAALTNGIETYNCGDATQNVIGSMENVTIDAQGTGMLISAPCGTATNCTISGGTNGIEIWIKGNYSASLNLVDSDVTGGVFAHDEFSSNPDIVNNGSLSLTVDEATTGAATSNVTLTLARAEENVQGLLKEIVDASEAKVNDTYYATFTAAMAAAKAGDTVTVFEGTYAVPSMKAGITVVGEGNVLLEGTLSGTLEDLTLKNLHIKGANAQRWAYAKGDLVFENVTFEATSVYALHFDGITEGATLLYKDCTIIGWAAMSGSPASCTFEGCTIKDNGAYGVIRTYFPATIKGCTFDVDGANTTDVYQDGIHAVGATIMVENSTNANGDIKDILNISGASKIYVDGVLVLAPVVATIGDVEYFTLQDAENAAKDGDTIVLTDNIVLDSMVTFFNSASERMVTLDMNGKTITLSDNWNDAKDKSAFWVCDGLTVTGNGTIEAAPAGDPYAYVFIVGHRNAGTTNGYSGKLVIENGTFSSDDASVVSVTNGTATILGGSYTSAGPNVDGKYMTLNCIDDMRAAGKASIVVKGGTFANFNPENNGAEGADTNFCADGYIAETADEGATYTVRELKHLVIIVSPVATMSTETITVATMDEAVAYAQANPADSVTYQITGPVELTTGFSHGILDLGKNVVIEGVTDEAKLTIVGGGVPDIKGVTFKNLTLADEGEYLPTANEFMYQNFIDCSFENVTFEDGIRLSGTSTVTNCTVNANTTNEYAIWLDEGEFTMTGSTVTGGANAYGLIKSDEVDKITITGNTFEYLAKANKEALNTKGAIIIATDNTFIDCTEGIIPADKTNYAADGTTVLTEADITSGNTVKITVAKIGDVKYETLTAAAKAANAGDTITFLTDITEDATVSKSVTIDGAGHKYTGNIQVKGGNAVATIQNVNFVGGTGYAVTTNTINSITIENCTVSGYTYGFLYANKSTPVITVKNVTVDGGTSGINWNYGTSGINWNYGTSATLENVVISNVEYGINTRNYGTKTLTIKNCKIDAVTPLRIDEKGTAKQTYVFKGLNEIATLPTSDYAIVKGAQCGKYVGDIQPVVEKAQTGDTVKLLSDIALTEADRAVNADRNVLIDVDGKDITLDMNGKKISVVHEDAFTNDYIVAVIRVADGAGLTVTGNGTIDVKVLAEDPDMAYMFWKRGTTGHLTIENGTYHMNDSADSMVYTNGNEIVNIKGGTWTLDAYGTRGNREPWIFNVAGAGDNHVVVTGGTFNADINRQFWSNEVLVPETYYTVENGNGTWTVKEGAVAYVNEGMLTGPYFVRKNIGYATLEEAIAAVDDNETVTLLTDIALSETLVLDVEKNITLDGNGHKLTMAENYKDTQNALIMVGNSAYGDAETATHSVTIKNVVFDGIKGWSVIRSQGVTLTVDGCTIQNCEHTSGQSLLRLDYTEATIQNTTIKDNNALMAITHNFNGNSSNSKLTVDECVIERNTFNKTAGIYYVTGGGCEIKNSEFVDNKVNAANNCAVIYLGFQDKCTVTGNLFKNNAVTDASTSTRVAGAIFAGYQATITGNAFDGNTAANANGDTLGQICISTYYEDGYVELSGNYWGGEAPVYGKDYTIQHQTGAGDYGMDSYYTAYTLDADGNVVLSGEVVNTLVAAIGTKKFTTLTEALAEAKSGETVQLLKDVTTDQMVLVMEGVTLDLNGYTLTTSNYLLAIFKDSYVIDSSEEKSGMLKIDATKMKLLSTNTMLPVRVAEDTATKETTFKFAEFTLYQEWSTKYNRFQFWIDETDALLPSLYGKMTEGVTSDELNIKFQIEAVWDTGSQVFEFEEKHVDEYMEKWDTASLYLNIKGTEGVTGLKYRARIVYGTETGNQVFIQLGDYVSHVYQATN